jgi:hypothetical protein
VRGLIADAPGDMDGPAGLAPAGLFCFVGRWFGMNAGAIRRRRWLCYTLAPAAQFIQTRAGGSLMPDNARYADVRIERVPRYGGST